MPGTAAVPGGPGAQPAAGGAEAPGLPPDAAPATPLALLRRETPRKLVHMGTAGVAMLLAWQLPPLGARALFLAVALLALAIDLARRRSPSFRRYFTRAFGSMLRPGEAGRLTGATTLALGFALSVLLAPRAVAVVGIGCAGFADAAGALVGRAFGRHRFRSGKSLEGALAFAAVTFLVGWASPVLAAGPAVLVAVTLAAAEAAPLPADDNFLVPVLASALAWAASFLP